MTASFSLGAAMLSVLVQGTEPSVRGTVSDAETGDPLYGSVVSLPDLDRATVTNAAGSYLFDDVPPGPQHLSVQHLGYRARTLHALVPREGDLRVNVFLRPDPIPINGLDVSSQIAIRGAEPNDSTSFPDRESSIAVVRTHPLLGEPDVIQALGGGEVVIGPESPRGMHVRGGTSDQTGFLLDGIPVFNPYHSAGLFSAWNPDAISRVALSSFAPSGALPDALSGVLSAATRTPGPQIRGQGALSNTQIRVTLDGPLGIPEAGFLIAARAGFPGGLFAPDEPSYIRGESGDWLAKLDGKILGGQAYALGYDARNEVDASSRAGTPEPDGQGAFRNTFRWDSRSVGVGWGRRWEWGSVTLRSWFASGDAGSIWNSQEEPARKMKSERRDRGLLIEAERRRADALWVAGLRIENSRTAYRVGLHDAEEELSNLEASTPTLSAFFQHVHPLGASIEVDLGAVITLAEGDSHLGPRANVQLKPTPTLSLSAGVARMHQYSQSLRNSESVVGNVFPVDLFIGAGAPGVPVARSDQIVLAGEYRPAPGIQVSGQVYVKNFRDLLLVAPLERGGFSTGEFTTGSGTSKGIALEAAASTSRAGALASYGWQRVRLEHPDGSFVPEWGAVHLLDGGVVLFPTVNSTLKIGARAAMGRKTTAVDGELEWEACNLLDKGCEFGGTPEIGDGPLGGTDLPSYFRLDVSVRNHWHKRLGRKEFIIAVFGTFTNVLGRKNLLTFATDPVTGKRVGLEMRPQSPLVFGFDWRF